MLIIFIFWGGHFLAPQMKILPSKLGVNFAFALSIIFFAHFEQKWLIGYRKCVTRDQ